MAETADALPRQEIRLAMTMVGGASLAIWMGGIAAETSQLLREARGSAPAGVYRKLTGLLRADVSADVLTGTSAGGINAACLGLAEAFDSTPESLRDTWISTGSLDNLTRDPAEPEPRSLLDGDRVLLGGVRDALSGIVADRSPAADPPDLTVLLTGTMIDGESTRYEDALGNLVRDTEHRMLFRFHREQWQSKDVVGPLALAARSTASYPGAFELSRVPIGAGQADDEHPDMSPYTELGRSHWVTDGGVLLNKPLRPALQEIFARSATSDVRRLLLYVAPTGEREAAAKKPCAADDFPMLTNTMGKVVTAVMSQSISSELEELSRHNAGVVRARDTRVILAGLGLRDGAKPLVDRRLALAYLERRTAADAADLVELAARRYARSRVDSPEQQWSTGLSVPLRETAANGLMSEIPAGPPGARMAPEALLPYRTSALADAVATGLQLINAAFQLGPDAADAEVLNQARATLHRARADSARERKLDRWVSEQAAPSPDTALETWVAELAVKWASLGRTGGLADAWSSVVAALRTTAPALRRRVEARPDECDVVATLLEWLALEGETDDDVVRARLLALHIAGRGLLAEAPSVDQRADLVQVSADSRTLLDMNRRRAWDKLTGMQAGNFGAFYKASWRANDWMWGRIDGAGWLMQVLLDPVRLRNLAGIAGPDVFRAQVKAAFEEIWVPPRVADNLGEDDVAMLTGQLDQELAFLGLDSGLEPVGYSATLPESMPVTALVLARARQLEIARAELPVVCRHADDDVVKEKASDKMSKVFRGLAKPDPKTGEPVLPLDSDDRTQQVFQACRVSAERISAERGSPLLVKTMIKLAAAGVNAAAATVPASTPKAARSTVTAVRATARSTWRITKGSMALKTPGTIVAAVLALVAGLLMGGNGNAVIGLIGLPVLAGGVVFVVVNVLLMSKKSPLLLLYLIGLLALLGLVLAPFLPVLARPFFGWLGSVVAGWGRGDAPVAWVVFVAVMLVPWVVPPLGALWRRVRPGDRPAKPGEPAKTVAGPVVLTAPAKVAVPDPAAERSP